MGILTNLNSLKQHMDIEDDSDQNTLLNSLIDEVDEVIANELGRGRVAGSHPITSAAATEYYDGQGREQLLLNRRPVTVITTVAVDAGGYYNKGTSPFASATEWTDGQDFAALRLDASESNPGILISLQKPGKSQIMRSGQSSNLGVWPKGRGNIKVTYTAGYATIPNDLRLAANLLVSRTWTACNMSLGGPVDQVSLGDQSYRLLQGSDMGTVQRIISRYSA